MLKNITKFAEAVKMAIKSLDDKISLSKKSKKVKILASVALKNTIYSKKGINYILKVTLFVSVIVTSFTITSRFTKNNAQAVYINNKPIGIIDNVEITENELCSNIENKLSEENGVNASINEDISLVPIIASDSDISSEYEILNTVVNDVSYTVDSYAINVNGEKKVLLKSKKEAENLLSDIKSQRIDNSGEILSVSFVDDIKISEESTDSDNIMTYDDAYEILNKNTEDKKSYTISEGDTLGKISEDLNISLSDIYALNPDITEDTVLKIGDEITITEEKPLLSVNVVKKVSYKEEIPYETEEIKNNEEYKTYKKVIKKGKEGEKAVTDEVIYKDGKETSRKTLKETVLKEPENAKVEIGTLETPVKKATGVFKMPVRGVLTSGFGARWGYIHKGIDIGAPMGTPVYASDGGVVTFSGWNDGGFGYLVKISHGNGFETYYAHNSSVAVSAGDRVYQGQLISYVGSTGNSTGNHLHFEIRENGVANNPYNYLS